MTQRRRQMLAASEGVLLGTVLVLALGCINHVEAQTPPQGWSQDSINATLSERQSALSARLDKIETLLQYGMVGLVGNLIAHIFQIQTLRKKD